MVEKKEQSAFYWDEILFIVFIVTANDEISTRIKRKFFITI